MRGYPDRGFPQKRWGGGVRTLEETMRLSKPTERTKSYNSLELVPLTSNLVPLKYTKEKTDEPTLFHVDLKYLSSS